MNREKLIAAGINYDEGLHRFVGKPELYEKYLKKMFQDSSMADLTRCLQEKNYPEAFRAAHTLKGIAGNLSVNQLYQSISLLVEALRGNDSPEDPTPLFEQVKTLYEQARQAVEE